MGGRLVACLVRDCDGLPLGWGRACSRVGQTGEEAGLAVWPGAVFKDGKKQAEV